MRAWPFAGVACVLAGAGIAPGAAAQEAPEGAGSDRPPACAAVEHREFDFWVGTWEVFDPTGRRVGANTIEPILGGCVLRESWQSGGAHAGTSYNIFDASRGRWHQTWVDNGGLLLQLEGALQGEEMVLSGETVAPERGTVLHRITWTPVSPDSVRQRWETSRDGGSAWTTVFDGTYVRKE